jgi:hypothetical protein
MASMQRRWGPGVSGIGGILQPFWDGLKLGVKEPILPELSSAGAYSASPMISFSGVMLAGWDSNSKYAFLGCLRSVALMVSYELSLGAVLLSLGLFITDSTGVKCLAFIDAPSTPLFALLPLCHIFLIGILAETKRVPFDLPEAEAELVAGYNVEYSSLGFALFFIAEYANMAVMSAVASMYFWRFLRSEDCGAVILLRVGAWHAATLPLRPIHAPGLEIAYADEPGTVRLERKLRLVDGPHVSVSGVGVSVREPGVGVGGVRVLVAFRLFIPAGWCGGGHPGLGGVRHQRGWSSWSWWCSSSAWV